MNFPTCRQGSGGTLQYTGGRRCADTWFQTAGCHLDILFVFTANPEDYTNRGAIVTPLKDRIESQILDPLSKIAGKCVGNYRTGGRTELRSKKKK